MVRDAFPAGVLTGAWARWIGFLIFAFPATVLVVDNAAAALLVVLAATGLYLRWRHPDPVPLTKDEKLLIFAVTLFFLIALLSYLFSDLSYLGWKKLWRAFRFLLLIPVYFAVRRMPACSGNWWGGLCTGSLLAGAWALLAAIFGADVERLQVSAITDPVIFGDIALAMAFMSLGAIPHYRSRHPALALFPIIAFFMGLTASFLSGVRGAWLAFPALTIVMFVLIARRMTWPQRLLALGFILALFGGVYAVPATGVAAQLHDTFAELGLIWKGQVPNGAIGMRFGLWNIAIETFLAHPVFGAGLGSFSDAVGQAVARGQAPAGFLDLPNPMNEYLSVLASRGLVGLVGLLLLFGVPFKQFVWGVMHKDRYLRRLGYAGIILIVAYLHFGISEAIFDRNMPIVFYAYSMAVTYGLMRAREYAYLHTRVERKQTLSVVMIVMDEADRIRSTLEAVHGWADEIVILDSGSSDNTVAICREFTDKVWETDWPGFGRQKQRALEKATCEWVLSIDADERVSEELRCEIDHELQARPRYSGYEIPRPLYIFGKQLDYGHSWHAPLRLFRRDLGRFTDRPVHEKVVLRSGHVHRLRSALYHETYRDYAHAMEKFDQYAWLQARERFARGRRITMVGAALRAGFNFFRNYIIHFGFLDGGRGFVLAMLNAQYTFNKYAGIWSLREMAHDPDQRPEGDQT